MNEKNILSITFIEFLFIQPFMRPFFQANQSCPTKNIIFKIAQKQVHKQSKVIQ